MRIEELKTEQIGNHFFNKYVLYTAVYGTFLFAYEWSPFFLFYCT